MDITHACGHVADADLTGGPAWKAKKQPCPNCRAARQRAIADFDTTMPVLVGTPDQIALARAIRADAFLGAPQFRSIRQAAAMVFGTDDPANPVLTDAAEAACRRQTDAAWWFRFQVGTSIQPIIDELLTDAERATIVEAAAQWMPADKPLRAKWIARIGRTA